MPTVNDTGEVVVTLSAAEVREAIEHAAWCAAVDDNPSIAVTSSEVEPDGDGYRVTYIKRKD